MLNMSAGAEKKLNEDSIAENVPWVAPGSFINPPTVENVESVLVIHAGAPEYSAPVEACWNKPLTAPGILPE
jgi:hypothetical protein